MDKYKGAKHTPVPLEPAVIDEYCGGSLSKSEIVEAVKTDQEVIRFLTTCGEENLQFLLHPPRLPTGGRASCCPPLVSGGSGFE